MAVQFILGRAGSGKSHFCLESIREALRLSPRGSPLVLLVPEQATYQAERALVTTPGLGGYCRAFVLSFRRLAYQVFLETGGPGLPPLEAAGKQMILRSILNRRAAELRLFGKCARQRGFVERLAATLAEFRAYGQWAGRLRAELALLDERGEGDSLLAAKLYDLALVIDDFEQFLAERYVDPDSYLDILPLRLVQKNRFHNSHVWVDGFASFTGQEERALEALMRISTETKIALCLDPREIENAQPGADELSIFSLLRETHERLANLARINQLPIRPPILLPGEKQPTRFSSTPALAELERRVFHLPVAEGKASSAGGAVRILAAADQRSEVQWVAGEILRLCRREGFRFREIAVITRDLAPYRALVEAIFSDWEIPHFIDIRRETAHHPLVELIRSALAVVARGWRTADVLRYAKTDLVPLDRAAIDEVENYALAHGIEGGLWYGEEPWGFRRQYTLGEDSEPRGPAASVEKADSCRRLLAAPLRAFEEEATRPGATVRDLCRALFELLESLEVAKRLEQWAAEAEGEGRLDAADEQRQVWAAVVDLLDQAVAALGDERVDLDEYLEIVEAGLAGIRLRLVPPALDQVLVGSIERSRHPEIRAAFVMGMNERHFPMPQTQDVVFGDRERERLAADGLRLGPVSEKRLLHERFLGYIAFTRASERLYVSYAKADPLGKSLHPSPFLDELRACFADLEEGTEPGDPLDRICHRRGAISAFVEGWRDRRRAGIGGDRAVWLGLYEAMRRDGDLCGPLARRIGGLVYTNKAESLGRRLARRLYGRGAESSISRLECFAACPFKHFARYGLRLEERDRFRLERVDLGLLYHAVLKRLFERLSGGKPLDWGKVDPERAARLLGETIDQLAPQLRGEILLSTGQNRYLLDHARRALDRFLRVLIEAAQRDRFCQVSAECAFARDGELPPVEIDLDGDQRLLLRGRIDRVDLAIGEKNVVRVIDFKSRSRRFLVVELAHGLTLQLPAYLLAVSRTTSGQPKENRPHPAGALYLPIFPEVEAVSPDKAFKEGDGEELDLACWRARGFFDFRWHSLFDSRLERGESSPVVWLKIKKDDKPYARCDAYEDDAVEVFLKWTERKLGELARRVFEGEVAVSPYQLGNSNACGWCEFRPVCRFDAQKQPYNMLSRDCNLAWLRERIGE